MAEPAITTQSPLYVPHAERAIRDAERQRLFSVFGAASWRDMPDAGLLLWEGFIRGRVAGGEGSR